MPDRFNSNEEVKWNAAAFKQGGDARMQQLDLDQNPYLRRGWEHKSWTAGWADADMAIILLENSPEGPEW